MFCIAYVSLLWRDLCIVCHARSDRRSGLRSVDRLALCFALICDEEHAAAVWLACSASNVRAIKDSVLCLNGNSCRFPLLWLVGPLSSLSIDTYSTKRADRAVLTATHYSPGQIDAPTAAREKRSRSSFHPCTLSISPPPSGPLHVRVLPPTSRPSRYHLIFYKALCIHVDASDWPSARALDICKGVVHERGLHTCPRRQPVFACAPECHSGRSSCGLQTLEKS